jgi:guanylate kinase
LSNKGSLIVLSGLSGAGKGAIVKSLLARHPNEYVLSISATTREPRPGEEEGREYFFKTKEEFEEMIENKQLLEYARYLDNYYGTPKDWVMRQIAHNRNVVFEIDVNGAFQIKKIWKKAVLIFVVPPSMEELQRRLQQRGSETEAEIEERLARAKEELKQIKMYDYVITNDVVEKSADLLHNIILTNKEIQSGDRNMLHPSYTDLMNAVNAETDSGEQPVVQSRYSIVMAASKRARQIVDGADVLIEGESSKPLSIAIDEIYSQRVTILGNDSEQ